MSSKNEMLSALQEFKQAIHNLKNFWEIFEDEHGAGQFRRLYPFDKSFDHLVVDVFCWVDDVTKDLDAVQDIGITIKLSSEQIRILTDSGIKNSPFELNTEIDNLIDTRVSYLKGQ